MVMEEMVVVRNDMFVEPHFIESLACDGLTDVEVAQSLGVDVKSVRRKMREGFIHRCNIMMVQVSTVKNIKENDGSEFDAYNFGVEAAKFFVGN